MDETYDEERCVNAQLAITNCRFILEHTEGDEEYAKCILLQQLEAAKITRRNQSGEHLQ